MHLNEVSSGFSPKSWRFRSNALSLWHVLVLPLPSPAMAVQFSDACIPFISLQVPKLLTVFFYVFSHYYCNPWKERLRILTILFLESILWGRAEIPSTAFLKKKIITMSSHRCKLQIFCIFKFPFTKMLYKGQPSKTLTYKRLRVKVEWAWYL